MYKAFKGYMKLINIYEHFVDNERDLLQKGGLVKINIIVKQMILKLGPEHETILRGNQDRTVS